MIIDLRKDYLKPEQLKAVLGVSSTASVYRAVERIKPFKLYRFGERAVVAKRVEVERWLAKQGRTLDAA